MTVASPPVQAVDRALAIFDLDGTLLTTDSFLPFLITYAWRRGRLFPLAVLPFYLVLYACRVMRDFQAKERLLTVFFAGEPMDRISAHAAWFCDSYVARRLRPELLTRLGGHLAAGDRVILLSASPDLYVPAIARYLSIPEVVCTPVEVEGSVCRGRLCGDNCKGEAKVAALRRYLGGEPPPGSAAYGDSRHDLPILRWVERGYLVRRQGLIRVGASSPD